MTGGPAGPYNYRLHHVMFHFGRLPDGEMGSEHTVKTKNAPFFMKNRTFRISTKMATFFPTGLVL